MTEPSPFWKTKPLEAMSEAEWESLCDGCGKCCMVLLEDEDTGELYETSVSCRLFDPEARRCSAYADRLRLVPGCVQVTPKNAGTLSWMPRSCAYRRLAEGRDLADWHPLVSGRPESVEEAGEAVSKDLRSEARVKASKLWRYVTRERD
ncbi:YcgN family cysteine cluster protein [Parvularcula dongshanensis]|uniref:UPF0260 protein GGQ59_001046 n=1 Tax=Parvularcula dongshanensis TaxID=1173995 RepID=A0A840I0F1_9PROT|nr:hypothetical protein [Parvularcula dongshanensis]